MVWMTRTPLRVSLFGGGTDYPEYFNRHPGSVVGFGINQYIHIAALRLGSFLDYKYRVSYSKLEYCMSIDQIQHPVVREVLKNMAIDELLDISVMSDLPASGSGLGSSSAFTVGFLMLCNAIKKNPATKIDLARAAINVERNLLKENVGIQDQLHTAFGGFNRFDFHGDNISVIPLQISGSIISMLRKNLVLVHTGIARRATETVKAQVEATKTKALDQDLSELRNLVDECVNLLESQSVDVLENLGRMLSESWYIKRNLTSAISNESIDNIFEAIVGAGAYGAKLCGAGGGGFFLALIAPEKLDALREAVAPNGIISIDIDLNGTSLVFPTSSLG